MGNPKRKDYIRYDLDTLEQIILPELLDGETQRGGYPVQKISHKYDIEQGLLLLMVSGLWETFREVYKTNNIDKVFLDFTEYKKTGKLTNLTREKKCLKSLIVLTR